MKKEPDQPLRVALCGNPNVGKSTVFNALTGLRQHTGNWTGKTVETAEGRVRAGDREWRLTDLPGTYSLLSGSPEEEVACDFLCFSQMDATIVVCDATCLERNLNVTLQVIEAARHVVVCVNLMDEAKRQGIHVDLPRLECLLGVPVVGVCARSGAGLEALKKRVGEACKATCGQCHGRSMLRYPPEIEEAIEGLRKPLEAVLPQGAGFRFVALRILASGMDFLHQALKENMQPERQAAWHALEAASRQAKETLEKAGQKPEDVVAAVVCAGYEAAGRVCAATVNHPSASGEERRQLRMDRLLCSKRVGIPLMLALLGLVFYITLSGANVPSAWISQALMGFQPTLSGLLQALRAPEWLQNLLVLGVYRVVAWVVSVMLPPMAIFFPLFTLLEDLGFLPRVAFNLDRCFKGCKACGKQALCMCMGLFRLSKRHSTMSNTYFIAFDKTLNMNFENTFLPGFILHG